MDQEYLSKEDSEKVINKVIRDGDLDRINSVMENILYKKDTFTQKKEDKEYFLNENLSKDYLEIKFRQFSELFLTQNTVDLELLKDVVSIQNGLKPSLIQEEKVIDYIKEGYSSLKGQPTDRISFLKQIKFLEEEGIINEENTPLLQNLKVNSEYADIKLTQEEEYNFSLKNIINNKYKNNGIVEQQKVEEDEKFLDEQRAKIEKDRDEYWTKKFREELLKQGYSEMVFKDSDKPRKTSDNTILDKFYEKLYNLKKEGFIFKEDTSIVRMNANYDIPEYSIYKRAKNNNGIYFDDLHILTQNKEAMSEILRLSALDVRSQGIKNPYVYTSPFLNNQDALHKKQYVEAQIRALVEHGEYSFDNIKVQKQHQDVYDRLLEEYASKRVSVIDMDKIVEGLIDNSTSRIDRKILLNHLNENNFLNGHTQSEFLMQNNIVPEEYNSMLKKINDKSKPLTEKEINNLSLVLEYIDTIGSSLKNNEVTLPKVEGMKINPEDPKEIQSKIIQFTKPEKELIDNNKTITSFNDYENKKNTDGTNHDYDLIKSLAIKIKDPDFKDLVSELSEKTIDAIKRKSMLIDLHENNPHISPELKQTFVNLLNQEIDESNLQKVLYRIGGDNSLVEIGDTIRNNSLVEIADYIKFKIQHEALGNLDLHQNYQQFELQDPPEEYIPKGSEQFVYDNNLTEESLPQATTNPFEEKNRQKKEARNTLKPTIK